MTVGPLEVLVIERPGQTLKDEVIAALTSAVDNGTLRSIDVMFVHNDRAGLLCRTRSQLGTVPHASDSERSGCERGSRWVTR